MAKAISYDNKLDLISKTLFMAKDISNDNSLTIDFPVKVFWNISKK